MQLISPDLFAEVSRLSVGACVIGVILGIAIWLTGWWQHRFWVVTILTAVAGIIGLQQGKAAGAQPLVAGLLAALAAGWMAMELARVLAFIGGGLTGSILVQNFVPTVHDPLIAFLAGGLFGVVLFRIWMLVLTSFIGATTAVYAGLGLGQHISKSDLQIVVTDKPGMLNLIVGAGVLGGVLLQGKFDSWLGASGDRKKNKAMKVMSDAEKDALKTVKTRGPISLLLLPKKAG
jgi:hypothetical protein